MKLFLILSAFWAIYVITESVTENYGLAPLIRVRHGIYASSVKKRSTEMVRSLSKEQADVTLFNFVASYGYYAPPLNETWVHLCVASVLTENVVMISAHCLRSHDANRQLLLGQSELNGEIWSPNRQLVNISAVIMHPSYNNVTAYFDIGKIYTAKAIKFNKAVQPIHLYDQPFENNAFATKFREYGIAGWGLESPQLNTKSDLKPKLRYSHLLPYSNKYCDNLYRISGTGNDAKERERFLPNLMTLQTFCAGSAIQDHGSCKGDSGKCHNGPSINFFISVGGGG